MRLRAVTFDFWSTLVDGSTDEQRAAVRMARLQAHISGAGHVCTVEELREAFRRMIRRVDDEARESLIDVGPPGRWAYLAEELGIVDGAVNFDVFERAYEDITLNPLPAEMPYVHEAVGAMKAAGYRLGVICNTGMAGGRILREVLRRYDLLDCFDVTVFSNEFGFSKPNPKIFEHTLRELGGIAPHEALHVGDLEELDIDGARRAGVHSALYAPEAPADLDTEAELVVRDWRAFAGQITNRLKQPDGGRSIGPR